VGSPLRAPDLEYNRGKSSRHDGAFRSGRVCLGASFERRVRSAFFALPTECPEWTVLVRAPSASSLNCNLASSSVHWSRWYPFRPWKPRRPPNRNLRGIRRADLVPGVGGQGCRNANDQGSDRNLPKVEAVPHVVSALVPFGEVPQTPSLLDKLENRAEFVTVVRDVTPFGEGRNHDHGNARPETVCINLRWRHMVVEASVRDVAAVVIAHCIGGSFSPYEPIHVTIVLGSARGFPIA
jgi:hypothetical protein